jgi:hypothetical protein
MAGDSSKHVREISFRIDSVQFRRSDHAAHCSRAFAASIGSCE